MSILNRLHCYDLHREPIMRKSRLKPAMPVSICIRRRADYICAKYLAAHDDGFSPVRYCHNNKGYIGSKTGSSTLRTVGQFRSHFLSYCITGGPTSGMPPINASSNDVPMYLKYVRVASLLSTLGVATFRRPIQSPSLYHSCSLCSRGN